MLFNSFNFLFFFAIVYGLYLALNHRRRNLLLLAASYFFYACWDWRFLSLIIFSTCVDFFCGLQIERAENRKQQKLYLAISVITNLSLLAVFKYFHFFIENFQFLLSFLNLELNTSTLHIILPVGISFYTFQTMSYTIDIYRGKIVSTRKFFDFALFVAFFPQLIAGPIERASHLLPQVLNPRKITINGFTEGCYLFFGGLFQKVVIADNLVRISDSLFANHTQLDSSGVLLAMYAFAFQIYCDFAGYSNMARGLGRVMGFDIMVNFNSPYLSSNPSMFWKRWHISLSQWLRDYLYIPLGGNQSGHWKTIRNLFLTMLIGGLWHGAAWTFILWGAFHGFLLVVYKGLEPLKTSILKNMSPFLSKLSHGFSVIVFFHLVCFGWLIFRAETLSQFFDMTKTLFIFNFDHFDLHWFQLEFCLYPLAFLYLLIDRNKQPFALLKENAVTRFSIYVLGFYLFLIFGVPNAEQFIYFQF